MLSSNDPVLATDASDAELLAQSVDAPARFDEVMGRHLDAIFGFVAMQVGPQVAEDVVAETFATAFQLRGRFDAAATSARPWLYGIAVNHLHKHRAAQQRWLRGAQLERVTRSGDDVAQVDARLDAQALRPDLARILEVLAPGERDVLLLHALGELDHAEIAHVLGIRRGTAKTRLSRATARLRTLLGNIDELKGEPNA